MDNGGCCLRGKVLGVVGDQAGDGQGVAVEVDGAGGAGLLGDGDELVKGWSKGGLLNCPSILAVEVTFQPFMVKVLEDLLTPGWVRVRGSAKSVGEGV